MEDVGLYEFYKYLSYEEIINLCNTNYLFSSICRNNETWKYLMKRDFAIDYIGVDAYREYLKYKNALDIFSTRFPIITQRALINIVDNISSQYWNQIINSRYGNEEGIFNNKQFKLYSRK